MIALDLLLDTVPDSLVGEAAHKRLRRIGDHLPDALTGRIGLEARLHDDPQVDLLLRVATPRELSVLGGTDNAINLGVDLVSHPAWQAVARLARRALCLIGEESPLPPDIWLEFNEGRFSPPTPGVFTAAAPGVTDRRGIGWDVAATVTDVMHAGADGGAAPGLDEQVRRVAASGIRLRQVGMFPGRPGIAVRLFCAVDGHSAMAKPRQIVHALKLAGWSGPTKSVLRWASICAERADALYVSIDVGTSGIMPTVGIEFSLAGAVQPRDDARWDEMLRVLRREGMCTAAKAAGVNELGRSYHAAINSRQYRQGVHHLKVTVAPDGGATAKVYFGAYEVTPHTTAVSV